MEFMENRSPVTERHVQAIWYDAALRPRTLRTVRGAPVRVVHPGCWNLSAGHYQNIVTPEFRYTGIGWAKDAKGENVYIVQIFMY